MPFSRRVGIVTSPTAPLFATPKASHAAPERSRALFTGSGGRRRGPRHRTGYQKITSIMARSSKGRQKDLVCADRIGGVIHWGPLGINEEEVARAISIDNSVISAGHETDFTNSDGVDDRRILHPSLGRAGCPRKINLRALAQMGQTYRDLCVTNVNARTQCKSMRFSSLDECEASSATPCVTSLARIVCKSSSVTQYKQHMVVPTI